MRRFFHDHFHVPASGKVGETVMLSRITASVGAIVLCLVCISMTAYAFFSYDAARVVQPADPAWRQATVSATDGLTPTANVYTLENTGAQERLFTFVLQRPDSEDLPDLGYFKIRVKTNANDWNDTTDDQLFFSRSVDAAHPAQTLRIAVAAGQTAWVTFSYEFGSCSLAAVETVQPVFA